jgi:hypothetical protein
MKLNKIQQEWVNALRSGKYKQGKGNLRRGNKFCCLGVLCDLAAKSIPSTVAIDFAFAGAFRYDGNKCSLPDSVQNWASMSTDYGRISCDINLMKLNDKGATFLEIADFIEDNADKLFVEEVK